MSDTVRLPDESASAVVSLPLPSDHWLKAPGSEPPPMPMRVGTSQLELREQLREAVVSATRHAYRAASVRGTASVDPDALVQNMVVALLGYNTPDGLSSGEWANPNPVPVGFRGKIGASPGAVLVAFTTHDMGENEALREYLDCQGNGLALFEKAERRRIKANDKHVFKIVVTSEKVSK